MPQETRKVTIICPDAALAERIKNGVVDQASTEVVTSFDKPEDEYKAALYVHIPPLEASDEPMPDKFGCLLGPSCEPIMSPPPLAALEFETLPHRDAYRSLGLPDLGPGDLLRGIRIGRILAVAFAEPISVPGTPSEQEPARAAECLGGFLLPYVDAPDYVGFGFRKLEPPYSKCQAAPGAPWASELVPRLGPQFHVSIEPYPSKERVQEEIAKTYLTQDLQEWDEYERRKRDISRDTLDGLRDLVTLPQAATKSTAVSRRGRADKRALLHKYVPVRIEPLLVPTSGDLSRPFGIAVRIGKGVVLVLPECRDQEAKAKVLRRLVTGLWDEIQEWCKQGISLDTREQSGVSGHNREGEEDHKKGEEARDAVAAARKFLSRMLEYASVVADELRRCTPSIRPNVGRSRDTCQALQWQLRALGVLADRQSSDLTALEGYGVPAATLMSVFSTDHRSRGRPAMESLRDLAEKTLEVVVQGGSGPPEDLVEEWDQAIAQLAEVAENLETTLLDREQSIPDEPDRRAAIPEQGAASENREDEEQVGDVPAQLAKLEEETPPLDRDSGAWVKGTQAARLECRETGTLRKYRSLGIKSENGALGRDPDGRVWRKPGTRNSRAWYLASTLLSQRR